MKTNSIEKLTGNLSLDSRPIGKLYGILDKLHLTPNEALIGLGIITISGVIIYVIQCGCSISGELSYKDANIKFEIKKGEECLDMLA